MPNSKYEHVLAQATEKEKKYDWLGAVELHERALNQIFKQRDLWKASEIQERIGYCFQKASMQAENTTEFSDRMNLAKVNYEKAKDLLERTSEPSKNPRILRSNAMIAYLGFWLTLDVSEKKRLLSECWRRTKQALDAFKEAGDALEYGKTYNDLSSSAFFGYTFEWNFRVGKALTREAMEYGAQAITFLSSIDETYELARAYAKTGIQHSFFGWYFIPDMDEKETYRQGGQDYWQKAIALSEQAALLELSNISGIMFDEMNWTFNEMLANYGAALDYSKKTRDKYLIGTALEGLAYASYWIAARTDDPDRRLEILQRALHYAENAKYHFSLISFSSPRNLVLWAELPYAEYNWLKANWETDIKKKRDLLEDAVKYGTDAIKSAEMTGYPGIISAMYHVLSHVLESLVQIETNREEKNRLLTKALEHRKKIFKLWEQVFPFCYWNQGINWNYLSDLKGELSKFEKTPIKRAKMLEEAISNKEIGLQLLMKENFYWEKKGELALFVVLGRDQYSHGESLTQLYELTNENEHLREAVKAFEEGAESYLKLDMVGLGAECYWKAGQWYDVLGEHLKAAENFTLASNNYKRAIEKIPQLQNFYQDYASYMQAWNEIEKAKECHGKSQYGQAKEYYETATNLHQSTKHWNYLTPNYLAWVQLEKAEDLSRREQTQEAIKFFQKASELFLEAKKSIQPKLEKIEVPEEKTMGTELVKASGLRHDYCLGRIAVEEAKILDRQGDHAASSSKYGSATRIFQEVAEAEPEESRNELQPIIFLCQAWQKMMMAEVKVSSILYREAAELFEQAKENTLNQQTSLLALANSSFCKALEAGTEFETTRDPKLYSIAKKHMDAAANYYLKAGFNEYSEYTKATHRLLDAHIYLDMAQIETEPKKKAEYCTIAEKLLQASVDSYIKANHSEKSEQVQRLLEDVREDRQLAVSLTEVLHTPAISTVTTSFSAPTPTHERAVGLERFEHAHIQANLSISKEAIIGEEVEVRLDLVNVAKEGGLLVRVDGLIPPSFKITTPPIEYTIEDGSINLKGKSLEPLKVESIKLSLETTKTGVIDLRPEIIYVDEVGNFQKCTPEPATVTVYPKLTVEFKIEAAQKVFDYLATSFIEDYMGQRLILHEAGWRSFVQIIRNAKLSSRSVYGRGGKQGSAILELERRGLIEVRIFPGERGRGGRIIKTRISYENEVVKRLIDQKIVKNE